MMPLCRQTALACTVPVDDLRKLRDCLPALLNQVLATVLSAASASTKTEEKENLIFQFQWVSQVLPNACDSRKLLNMYDV